MSDLLAPILVVMENEVDAFWCFAGIMDLMVCKGNYFYNPSHCILVTKYRALQFLSHKRLL